jgi:predicted lysophospholipase L1 biosynthesis ABC-type transport system permease subunit
LGGLCGKAPPFSNEGARAGGAIEYGVLGLLAGTIGSAGSIGVTWGLTTYGRVHVPWQFQPAINAIGIVVTTVLVAVVGVLASWDVIVRKPVAILREE